MKGIYLVLSTTKVWPHSFLDIAKMACEGGVNYIQLRDKRESTREVYKLAEEMCRVCKSYQVPFLVNDRIDVAMAVGADGVHLGQTDLPLLEARKIAKHMLIGGTASNKEEALLLNGHCDYFGLGHIYPTKTKVKTYSPLGPEMVTEVKKLTKTPIVAIGGINLETIESVIHSGADAVAVVRAICEQKDPEKATKKLKKSFETLSRTN